MAMEIWRPLAAMLGFSRRNARRAGTTKVRRKMRGRPLGFRPGAGCFEQLERREVFNATYHGGALLANVEVQAVYLGSNWVSQATLQNEATQLDQYLDYLVDSPYMDMLTDAGYGVGQGTASTGAKINVSLAGFNTITDADIQGVLVQAIDQSLIQQPTTNRLYVVYLESGRGLNFGGVTSQTGGLVGYHSAFLGADRQDVPFPIRYVVLPHPGTPNPTSATNGYTGVPETQVLTVGGTGSGTLTPRFNNVSSTIPLTWTDEVQLLELTGADGDTVQLSFDGQVGSAATELQYLGGAVPTAANVLAHLTSIPALAGTNAVQVTGSDGGPFTITFGGSLTGVNVDPLTASVGGTATASVTSATDGAAPTAAQVQASLATITALGTNVTVTAAASGGYHISVRSLGNISPIDVTTTTTGGVSGSIATTADGISPDFDQLTSVTSRMIANAVTDPDNNFRTRGWYDDQFGSEIADLGVPAAQIATVHSRLGPNRYYVQHVFNQSRTVIAPNTTSDPLNTAPGNITLQSLSLSRVQISWTAVVGATGYRVFLVQNGQSTLLSRVPASQTSTVLSNLTPGATYQFRVEAYNAANVSAASVTYTVPNPALTVPKNITVAKSPTSVTLTWNGSQGAAGYRIFMIQGTKRSLLATLGEQSQARITHTITGLKPKSTVSFRIEAFRGSKTLSATTQLITLPALPLKAPELTVTAINGNLRNVQLSWKKIDSAQGYRVYRVQGTKRVLMTTLSASATGHKVNGLPGGTQFVVQAFNGTKTATSQPKSVIV